MVAQVFIGPGVEQTKGRDHLMGLARQAFEGLKCVLFVYRLSENLPTVIDHRVR